MTISQLHTHFLESKGICTDTRKLSKGEIYFALKGENFNGNKFSKQAIDDGASIAIIDEEQYTSNKTILVKDVLLTLQELATYHRTYLGIPIIGLTGSNGKTTSKELINAVLSQKFTTTATIGNLNNHIGAPLTLLSMNKNTEIGIIEMGANHQKEIATLCDIARPNYGYITNFGKAHLEGFGGFEGVIKGKSELYDYLRSTKGTAIINDLDPLQKKQSTGIKTSTFGSNKSDLGINLKTTIPTLEIEIKETVIKSQLIGSYNYTNIAAAVAIGHLFKLSIEQIKRGVSNYVPTNNRSQIIEKNGFKIILDAYNANPTSMALALENLSLQKTNTVAFIGDMFEVGETAAQEHQIILELCKKLNISTVFAIGPSFGSSNPLLEQKTYLTFEAFSTEFINLIPKNSTILIKGSRGMKMEQVLDLLG